MEGTRTTLGLRLTRAQTIAIFVVIYKNNDKVKLGGSRTTPGLRLTCAQTITILVENPIFVVIDENNSKGKP